MHNLLLLMEENIIYFINLISHGLQNGMVTAPEEGTADIWTGNINPCHRAHPSFHDIGVTT